jgi:hypothetical protein
MVVKMEEDDEGWNSEDEIQAHTEGDEEILVEGRALAFRQSYNTQLPIQHLPLSHFRINHQLLLPPSWKSAMRKWRERRPGGSLLEPPYIIFACTCTVVHFVVPCVYMLALVRPPRYAVLKGS